MRCDATCNLVISHAFLLHSGDRLSSIISRHAFVTTVIASRVEERRFRSRSSYARHTCIYVSEVFSEGISGPGIGHFGFSCTPLHFWYMSLIWLHSLSQLYVRCTSYNYNLYLQDVIEMDPLRLRLSGGPCPINRQPRASTRPSADHPTHIGLSMHYHLYTQLLTILP